MRNILDGILNNIMKAILERLPLEGVELNGGGTFGSDGIILVNDKDVDNALEVLTRLGIPARVGKNSRRVYR